MAHRCGKADRIKYLCLDAPEVDLEPVLREVPATRQPFKEFGTPFAASLASLDTPAAEVIAALRKTAPAQVGFDTQAGESRR